MRIHSHQRWFSVSFSLITSIFQPPIRAMHTIHFLRQIPFYPYAINIILDDDPDINDQELDAQQQVFRHINFNLRLDCFFCVVH